MPESYPMGLLPVRLARLSGPLCIGVSVWCASGIVSVDSSSLDAGRVLAPAPWWLLLIGVLGGLLLPAWRRSPLTALPALFATLPWWPVPLPVAALLWTGPLAWLPLIAAFAAASGASLLGTAGRGMKVLEPNRAVTLAALLTMLMAGATLWSVGPRLPGGDEPHYLVITQSLWLDGDLRIENNHVRRDYAAYFPGILKPDYINRGQDGAIYSIHAPGVSTLVLPGFVVAGVLGAQITIVICLILAGVLVWRSAWGVTHDATAAWFAWASVMGALPIVLLGVMVFPDGPAALGVAAGVWLLTRLVQRPSRVRMVHLGAVSAVLSALPWLHSRFAFLAAGLGVAVVVAVWADTSLGPGARVRRILACIVIPAASAAVWLLSFWWLYGTLDPRAPYRGAESVRAWIWGAAVGLFADQQFGLYVFAPVLVVGLLGLGRAAARRLNVMGLALIGLLVGYTLMVSAYQMWWAGRPGLPARFLVAALPLLSVPIALAWARATRLGRTMYLTLLGVSWLMVALVVMVDHGLFAFNDRDGQAAWLEWLSPVVNLPRAWPSFFWRTEADFLLHVAAWVCVCGLGALVWWKSAQRFNASPDRVRFATAAWLLITLMVAADVGWRLNGVTGLDPARSQLAVHAAEHRWRVGRPSAIVIRSDEAPLFGRAATEVFVAGPVPAGRYNVHVEGHVYRDAMLSARVGRSPEPLVTWPLPVGPGRDLPLWLPAGASILSIRIDSLPAEGELSISLRPEGPAIQSAGVARAVAFDAGIPMYFLDNEVFVEGHGFWVRGAREAEVVWGAGPSAAGRQRQLHIRNGGAVNEISVRLGGWRDVVNLEPWQEVTIMLPAADATGTWRVAIRSSRGFRPSELNGGEDRRYLGVWIGP